MSQVDPICDVRAPSGNVQFEGCSPITRERRDLLSFVDAFLP